MNREQILFDAGLIIGKILAHTADEYEETSKTEGLKPEYVAHLRLLAELRRQYPTWKASPSATG